MPPGTRARARITQKAAGVVFGLDAAEVAFARSTPTSTIERLAPEGVWREGGPVLEVDGDAAALLSAERTALNFLQRLSGVATLTARCVEAVEGTGARILDTRKTTPGLRLLEKAAVVAGGGVNHRVGLFDMVLIKENHVAMAGGVGAAVRGRAAASPGCRSRSRRAPRPRSTRRSRPARRGSCSTTWRPRDARDRRPRRRPRRARGQRRHRRSRRSGPSRRPA